VEVEVDVTVEVLLDPVVEELLSPVVLEILLDSVEEAVLDTVVLDALVLDSAEELEMTDEVWLLLLLKITLVEVALHTAAYSVTVTITRPPLLPL
jgi:hypothetical protein